MDVSALVEASDSGWAMIIGTVDSAGQPWAGRAWSVRYEGKGVMRVAIDGQDPAVGDCLADGAYVAVTAADVETLDSIQLKGRSIGVEPAKRADLAGVGRNVERLLGAIEDTDGLSRKIVSRFVPGEYAICRVRCSAVFDQSPGPSAGAALQP